MASAAKAPVDVIKAFLTAMETMDYDTAFTHVADDCEYINGPLGTFHGPAAARAALEPFFSLMKENTFVIRREVASGPVVFMERLDRHLLPTGWIELPVTGVFEVHDGRITVWHDYFDAPTIQNQLPAA